MRRATAIVTLLIMIMMLSLSPALACTREELIPGARYRVIAINDDSPLRVRESPSRHADSYLMLPVGFEVYLSEAIIGEWAKVGYFATTCAGKVQFLEYGWVKYEYLELVIE